MTPDHLRRGRARRGMAPAAAATLLLVTLGSTAPAAHADPTPARSGSPAPLPTTVEGLKKELDKLQEEAAILTEQYNKTRVDLKAAKKAEQDAARKAAALRAQAEPARKRLGEIAAANYKGGRPDVLFMIDGTAEGLAASAYLAQRQVDTVAALEKQVGQAEAAEKAAQAKTTEVEKAAETSEEARGRAKAKVDEVLKRLEKLTTTNVYSPRTGLKAAVKGTGLPAEMARKAVAKLGAPYVWAAAGPSSFDCSGLVVWAYAQVGKSGLPHYTGSLYGLGTKVSRSELRSGDLVYFGSNLHHMGIYLSDGKYLHAPQTGDVVKISRLSERSDYAGANRIG
ncbi:NlpC/P60 family protein [Actinomadura sp. WMMB 499]|uniref:C40 family peptidase n=1 Tax=Actinomadura sp. WMMB 499 TaxID=1219491 RepID=UPI0020C75FEB|nr:NlpC/P60 family protein [Actinomadura sp. WMMB 499]